MSQISHKKASKSEQRRNALKEYYRLQREQQQTLPQKRPVAQDDDEHSGEPQEIDLAHCDFRTLITQTNNLSASINTINSTTKNIVYNNYYELIKLNDFLNDLTQLNLAAVVAKKKNKKKSVLDILGPSTADDAPADEEDVDTFERLRALMDKVEQFDSKTYAQDKQQHGKLHSSSHITELLQIEDFHESSESQQAYRSQLSLKISKWIKQLQLQPEPKESLIHQLQGLQGHL